MLPRLTPFEKLVLLSCIYLLTLDSWLLTRHMSLVEVELEPSCICLLPLQFVYLFSFFVWLMMMIWQLDDDVWCLPTVFATLVRNGIRLDKTSTLGATAASSPVSCRSLCLEVEEPGWQINWLASFTCWSWKDQVLHLDKFWITTKVACAWANAGVGWLRQTIWLKLAAASSAGLQTSERNPRYPRPWGKSISWPARRRLVWYFVACYYLILRENGFDLPQVPPIPLHSLLTSQVKEMGPWFHLVGNAVDDNCVFDLSGTLMITGKTCGRGWWIRIQEAIFLMALSKIVVWFAIVNICPIIMENEIWHCEWEIKLDQIKNDHISESQTRLVNNLRETSKNLVARYTDDGLMMAWLWQRTNTCTSPCGPSVNEASYSHHACRRFSPQCSMLLKTTAPCLQ